ncbi:hypothetical protein APHAL10511_006970 [Amanita phalloides]|nr:hypothetical protein APHAL10511_006970 [Amanita phalloides]
MVKGNSKSSASSATRKKHAKRAATQLQVEDPGPPPREKKAKGKERGKKKEPRQKVYIPPVKPAPPQPDPLDTTGLAHTLPPDLLVVLRSLGKKAEITKVRALEELQSSWVDKCKDGEMETIAHTLVEMLPVWFHHLPSTFLHSSRRIRALSATLHASLLRITPIHDQIMFFIRESASASQVENILGTWCMAAQDVDRMVSNVALKSWNTAVTFTRDTQPEYQRLCLEGELLKSLISFIQNAALDPLAVYTNLNPAPGPTPPPLPHKRSGTRTPVSVRKDVDQSSRAKTDDVEESEQDKKARIRCGAIGAIQWILDSNPESYKDMSSIIPSSALWSALCSAEICPFAGLESFGYAQSVVRKSAWFLLQSSLKLPRQYILSLLPTLSSAVLRSSWIEMDANVHSAMWQPLLTFLREYPDSWVIDSDKEIEDEDLDEESSDDANEGQVKSTPAMISRSSSAYREFLKFLESGCAGSPIQGYPTILIILSTIPINMLLTSSIPFSDLFTAMWMAVDSRALSSLQRSAASAAFLSSLIDCVLFIAKRLCNGENEKEASGRVFLSAEDPQTTAVLIIEEQTGRIWNSLCSNQLKVEEKKSSNMLSKFLASLHSGGEALFPPTWETVAKRVKETRDLNPLLNSTFLESLHDQFSIKAASKTLVTSLIRDIVQQSVEDIRSDLTNLNVEMIRGLPFLVNMINTVQEGLFMDPDMIEAVDGLLNEHAFLLLEHSSPLIRAYLEFRGDKEQCVKVWQALLSAVARQPQKGLVLMTPVLTAAQNGHLPPYLRPRDNELDSLISKWVDDAVEGSLGVGDLPLIEQVLRVGGHVLSKQGLCCVYHSLISTFHHKIQLVLWEGKASATLGPLLRLFEIVLEVAVGDCTSKDLDNAVVNIFVLAYLLPGCSPDDNTSVCHYAQKLWTVRLQRYSQEERGALIQSLKKRLRTLICMTETRLMPEDVVKVASQHATQLHLDFVADLLPSSEMYDDMLNALSQDVIHPSLAVIDPLIAFDEEDDAVSPEYDARGYSQYARAVSALILVLSENRQEAKQNVWALKHILSFIVYAKDLKDYPAGRSPLLSSEASNDLLDELLAKGAQITTYLLTSANETGWRENILNAVMKNTKLDGSNELSKLLVELITDAKNMDRSRATRILRMVLQHVLNDVDKVEADNWFALAKQLERNAPQTSMTIVSTVVERAPEPQRLDRYRNELAASLPGIEPSRINTDGLLTLRKLIATAPNPDSDVVFLPQHRAVNVVKACQQWVLSDEDIDEQVESAMLLVFLHLAPILHTVPGAHWEFIFDVIESNLEGSDIKDDMMLTVLARSLRLVLAIEDLASTNTSFSENWEPRKKKILRTVRDMVMVKLDETGISVPRSICRELILTVIQNLPSSLMDVDILPKMCHLLVDSSTQVQKMAYRLLSVAAKKRTEYLVIEAGVDVESTIKIDLPDELIAILRIDLGLGDPDSPWHEQSVFGCLLGWMLVFDSFQDASFKVRSSYIDQLRSLDLVSKEFMPSMLNLLQLNKGLVKAFKLDVWAVDEFYIEYYESGSAFSVPVLAAHLYYRALLTVPSLIHSWVLDCKDRQVSSALTSYTSAHFSPVIIKAELARVKSTEATSELADENFTVKVAASTNEVAAAYAVDEHQLEIRLKIPVDWPLHKIEVREVKRVGVDEHRWRAWILAVQQSIWSHNGRIVDGLGLFKKNVTLHFEGQTECAICYSIISPMDGSLPKKPCKTCRNRFHAGCLYKWFNTSHSSSCPLCRSDFI